MDLPRRKPNRLRDYDYSLPGCYFVTICTKDRQHLLWKEAVPAMGVGAAFGRPLLSRVGELVEQEIDHLHRTCCIYLLFLQCKNKCRMYYFYFAYMLFPETVTHDKRRTKKWSAKKSGTIYTQNFCFFNKIFYAFFIFYNDYIDCALFRKLSDYGKTG